mgnify:CR=1 FL=1
MNREKKDINVEIGARLREIRDNLHKSQADMAEALEITDDHYRKIEAGQVGLTLEKIKILFEKLHIDSTYLITGTKQEDFDLEKYLANCTKEQKVRLMKQYLAYVEVCMFR